MKQIVLGAALFLLISSSRASAAGPTLQKGQPRITHNILSTQLPVALLTDIKKDYKDYWITELSEEGKSKHPDYVIILENADQVLQLRSDDAQSWVVTDTHVKTI
jgi:hypothetical protein